MPKFYPHRPESSGTAMIYDCIPVKILVLGMQVAALLGQIGFIIFYEMSRILVLLQALSIVLMIFTIFVFARERKTLMRAHFCCASVAVLFPISGFCWITFLLIEKLFYTTSEYSTMDFILLIGSALFLAAYIFYLILCRRLLDLTPQNQDSLPELDTTQGLFQFNRDAYDGSERSQLLYPEV